MSFVNAYDLSVGASELAVAIKEGNFGSHIGLIFNSAKDGLQILHLEWHRKLGVQSFPNAKRECWIAATVTLPPSASKQVVGILRSIAVKKPNINYGLNFIAARNSFSANGIYKPPKGSDGLTCSTFVNEVFRASSINLLNEKSWKQTDKNKEWGNAVCLALKGWADDDHIGQVQKNVTGLRIRPEEVAAAAQLPRKRPYDFEELEDAALEVMDKVKEICSLKAAIFIGQI